MGVRCAVAFAGVVVTAGNAGATSISGTVTAEDGTPLGGVTVVAYDARLNYATATTTVDGTYAIRFLPAGPYRIRAMPPDDFPEVDRFLPDNRDFCSSDVVAPTDDATVDDADFVLPEGGTLAGRLVDMDGAPIPNAGVLVEGTSDTAALVQRVTTTDADGAFVAYGLDSDPDVAEPYRVYVGVDGWPRQYLGSTYQKDNAQIFDVAIGNDVEAGDHTLLDGITLSGTISGPAGAVAGGVVYAYSSSQVLDAPINPDGTWTADGLPPGDVLYWAESDGLATTYYPGAEGPTQERRSVSGDGDVVTDADLQLPAESTLTLAFSGDGALDEVSVLLYNAAKTVGRGGPLDADGNFTIHGLWPGEYTLSIHGADAGFVNDALRDDDGAVATIVVEAGENTIERALIPEARLSGRVTDEDGNPVYGASVYAYPSDGDSPTGVTTDADGNWSLGGLPEGDYRLRFSYDAYCGTDRDWATAWWADDGAGWQDNAYAEEAEEAGSFTHVVTGDRKTGMDLVMPRDDDHDEMGDAWERDNGLDATRDDSAEDADGDGFSNLDEWIAGTDPTDGTAKTGCGKGCATGAPGTSVGIAGLLAAFTARRRARSG
jgi:hypothetical protein